MNFLTGTACGDWKWCQFRSFCYKLDDFSDKTWSEAKEICRQDKSDLVIPTYFDEMKFIAADLVGLIVDTNWIYRVLIPVFTVCFAETKPKLLFLDGNSGVRKWIQV